MFEQSGTYTVEFEIETRDDQALHRALMGRGDVALGPAGTLAVTVDAQGLPDAARRAAGIARDCGAVVRRLVPDAVTAGEASLRAGRDLDPRALPEPFGDSPQPVYLWGEVVAVLPEGETLDIPYGRSDLEDARSVITAPAQG